MKRPVIAVLVLVLAWLAPAAIGAQEPAPAPAPGPMEELFAEKCGSCHSVGKGDRVGPDLKGAHERRSREWLLRMIKDPDALLDSDPDARALLAKYNNVRMPALGLTEEQAQGLLDLIARCSSEPCNLAGVFRAVTEAAPADVARGRALFLGTEGLKNGGPPCMSCHTASGAGGLVPGGTLARDLTFAFARLGDEGLDAALRNPTFPLMKHIYVADRALDKDEAFALRAFLFETNRGASEPGDKVSLPLVGVLGALVCLVVLNALWSRRLRGIRRSLTQSRGGVS